MQSHPMWSSGVGAHSFDSGLKVEKVLQGTDEEMKGLSDSLFAYDCAPQENPKVNPKAFKICSMRYWGLCKKDLMASRCNTATINLYKLVSQHIANYAYPLLLRLQVEGTGRSIVEEYHFLTRIVGKGEVG